MNVSSLPDGTLTFSVTLTDAAGNTGTAATATATLDTRLPAATRSRPTRRRSMPRQAAATGFTFANAATGTTYGYTVTSSGGTGSVTGSGSVTAATQDISGINVSVAAGRHA